MDNRTILSHTDTALSTVPNARRLGVFYALVCAGIQLAMQLILYITTRQMDNTGGLGGIGTRSVLSLVQTVATLGGSAAVIFLQFGHYRVALQTARQETSGRQTLLAGFRQFGPLLRLFFLQLALVLVLFFAAYNAAATLFMFLPGSTQTMEAMLPYVEDPTAMTDAVALQLLQKLTPLYILLVVVLLALLIPISYRLRLAEFSLMDGQSRALQALLGSYRTMRGKCFRLFLLDLRLWPFYLLTGLAAVLSYGDMLLGLEGDVWFWVFFLLGLLAQLAATALLAPRTHTAYAQFYLSAQPTTE